jgi:hypothetical protein
VSQANKSTKTVTRQVTLKSKLNCENKHSAVNVGRFLTDRRQTNCAVNFAWYLNGAGHHSEFQDLKTGNGPIFQVTSHNLKTRPFVIQTALNHWKSGQVR